MNRPADAEVMLRLISTADGGKDRPVVSGYRPTYEIKVGYLTSANHEFIDQPELSPGAQGRANVWFVSPEAYPHTLWPGREIVVSEGSQAVGFAVVIQVFNPVLACNNG